MSPAGNTGSLDSLFGNCPLLMLIFHIPPSGLCASAIRGLSTEIQNPNTISFFIACAFSALEKDLEFALGKAGVYLELPRLQAQL
jgi:hypothetical protein